MEVLHLFTHTLSGISTGKKLVKPFTFSFRRLQFSFVFLYHKKTTNIRWHIITHLTQLSYKKTHDLFIDPKFAQTSDRVSSTISFFTC